MPMRAGGSCRKPPRRVSTSSRRCWMRPARPWSWRDERRLVGKGAALPRERRAPGRPRPRSPRRVGRGGGREDRSRRRNRRRARRAAAARHRRERRHHRRGAGHAAGRDHACGTPAFCRGKLRRRRLPRRAPPLRRPRCGGAGDGPGQQQPRRGRRQLVHERRGRGGRQDPRPVARAQLHRGRVARDVRGRRPRGPGGRALRQADRAPAVARPRRLHRRRRRARAGAARRTDRGRLGPARPHRVEGPEVMAIIVDKETRLVVQGLTGSEGSFHGTRNKAYGTQVVAGVTPGKGGQDVEGIPVFDTVAEAVDKAGANTAMVFVPARFAGDAIYEAVDAGIETVICVAEGLPAHEMLRVYNYIRPQGITMLGPNCPGALSPGKANVGIIPAEVLAEGRIGLVSRSGTLTYQIGYELAQRGLGNSTIVGIGGDPVVGWSFTDVLGKFESDDETDVVVMVGEIGGDEEEKAARYVEAEMSKPVVAYVAGFTAPPGKTMGHAGAIITGSAGTAQAKKEALEAAGIRVGTAPTEVAELAAETAGARA